MYLDKNSTSLLNHENNSVMTPTKALRVISSKQDILFCDYMVLWLETRKNKIQPNTYETYHGQIINHIYPYFAEEGIYLRELTSEDIEEYYDHELSTGLSSNTVIRYHANIYTALKYATKKQLITENPMDNVERPKPTKYIANYYSAEQLEILLKISKTYDIYIAILLAAYLGLRRSEIVGLRWDCINFYQGTITIKRKAMRVRSKHGDIISEKLKTEASYRSLPLPKVLLEYLKQLKSYQKARMKDPDYYTGDAAYVCLDSTGHRLELNTITGQFRGIILKHDLDYIRFHDLRHSCASLLLSLGYSLRQIQEWLGHSNIVTTASIYAHVNVKDKVDMATCLNNSINVKL